MPDNIGPSDEELREMSKWLVLPGSGSAIYERLKEVRDRTRRETLEWSLNLVQNRFPISGIEHDIRLELTK